MVGRPMRTTLVLVLCAVAGFLAACGSGSKSPSTPTGTVPPPQPTTGKTGTPSTPSNTDRTTTQAGG